jgi:hypothetical protein
VRRHRRLGDLIGRGLLLDSDVLITVNQVGEEIQLVRLDLGARAWAETVPAEDGTSLEGIVRAAERFWDLRGLEWRFESVSESRANWERRG